MTDRTWLMAALEEAADAITFDPPERWSGWLVYLLERLQDEPINPTMITASVEHYEEFLRDLKGAIDARLEDGRW